MAGRNRRGEHKGLSSPDSEGVAAKVALDVKAIKAICKAVFEDEGCPRYEDADLEQTIARRIGPLVAGKQTHVRISMVENWAREFAKEKSRRWGDND